MNIKRICTAIFVLAITSAINAQTVKISNEISTQPRITIDNNSNYWNFNKGYFLRNEIIGEAISEDKRVKIKGRIRFDLQSLNPEENSIVSIKPRWSWNSAANATDGNRSSVAVLIKPVESLEVGIGNIEAAGYAFLCGPNLSRTMWNDKYKKGVNYIPDIVGKWQYIHELIKDGLQISYNGIPDLKIGIAFSSADKDRNTMLKKNMLNGLAAGFRYSNEKIEVGSNWKGNFGFEKGYSADDFDKSYQDHTIYLGFTYKGLSKAKIGTKINAALGYYTSKESKIAATNNVNSFVIGAGINLDFRNGIKDYISFAIGYTKDGSLKSQVLPFVIQNNFKYEISKDAEFGIDSCLARTSLKEKKAAISRKNIQNNTSYDLSRAINIPTLYSADYGWFVAVKPGFSLNVASHSFSLGVKTMILGEIVPIEKQGHESSWTAFSAKQATIEFPLSWKYTF